MAKIPLMQPTIAHGATRAGAVKTPFEFAGGQSLQRAGQAIGGFAGDFFNKLVTVKANNEQAQFQGMVNTAMEEWETYVAAHPAASFEELGKQQQRMISDLRAASTKATTPQAKANNATWLTANESLIKQRTQTAMETIRTRQEFATYGEIQKRNINTLDRNAYIDAKEGMVSAGLLDREYADAQQVNDFAVIDRAESIMAVKSASGIGFAAWQSTITPENPAGNLQAGYDAIDALQLPSGEKQNAESELKTRVDNRRGEAKYQLEQQQEADLDQINKLIFTDKNYTSAQEAVEASSLDETTQKQLLSDIESRAIATAKGVPIKTDREVFARLWNKSLDVWSGNITKQNFDKDLRDNSGKLGDTDYESLVRSAASTLRSSQASALSRANSEAGSLIVPHYAEDAWDQFKADVVRNLKPDIAKVFLKNANEERQIAFFALSRYNAELRDWIENNPDKTGKEFFQVSEQLKHVYWNRSIEELKQLRQQRETDLNIPVIGSQDAYDKLKSGTRYKDAQGRIAVKR